MNLIQGGKSIKHLSTFRIKIKLKQMYKITIKARSGEYDSAYGWQLDGIDHQDDFTDYMDDDHQSMLDKGLRNGYMRFELINGALWTITEYESDEQLTGLELEQLIDYTQGQWSDGIGEEFEQEPCAYTEDGKELYISPWYSAQIATATQTKIN